MVRRQGRAVLAALVLATTASAQATVYDVVNATSSISGIFYPTLTRAAQQADATATTYFEAAPSGSTTLTRTRIQFSSSNSYRQTQIANGILSGTETVSLTTIYNGVCTYQLAASSGTCTDTWAYINAGATVLSATDTYAGTVTSLVLDSNGNSFTGSGSSGLGAGAVVGIVIAVLVVLVFAAVLAMLLIRRQRQSRIAALSTSRVGRPMPGQDDPNSFGSSIQGFGSPSSADAKPYTGFDHSAAQHGQQFTIGEDLNPQVHANLTGNFSSTSPTRPQSRVPVPDYSANRGFEPHDAP